MSGQPRTGSPTDIIGEIARAFAGVRRDDGVTLHEADVIDRRGTDHERAAARAKDREVRWEDVPAAAIEQHDWILSFLDVKGFRYYIPAYMTWVLRNYERTRSLSVDSTIDALRLSADQAVHAWQMDRFQAFNRDQSKAICQFLTFMAYGTNRVDVRAGRDALRGYWRRFS
jgi:hypothetical protein